MDTTAQQWLAESKTDLETAQLLFNEKHYNACAFYCQQSGEKAFKALLYALDERPWGAFPCGVFGTSKGNQECRNR